MLEHVDGLIKEEKWDEARDILRALLKQDAHSAAGWWRYAQIAPDLEEACLALENVLLLEPDHARAKAALPILKRRASGPAQKSGA